jgi:stringent starvation protein B
MRLPPNAPASKREALLALLDQGMVMLHLDARRPGVQVPGYLTHEAHLRLNLSYRFLLDDLAIDDWGVRATLSFRGQPFLCRLPWSALFALTRSGTEEGWLWPGDLPPELAVTGETTDVAPAPTSPDSRPRLHEVPLEPDDPSAVGPAPEPRVPPRAEDDSDGDGAGPEPPHAPPNLRIVK